LLSSILFWVLFGWLADYSFPFDRALELLLSCFTGTVPATINNLQQQLQRTDVIPQHDNAQQVQKLNNLESQAWLYKGVLERLGSDPCANHEKIAKTLEALEYKRSEILQELEPRRPRSYRVLGEIQDSARDLLASQAEKDYEKLQKIVTNLILFMRSRQPSQVILSEAIAKLTSEIAQSSNQISPYRLRLAYKINELLSVLSEKLALNSNAPKTDINYQSLVNELHSRINLLSLEFNNLLRVRQEDKNKLGRYIREISTLTETISELHKDISNRDAHISDLRSNIQNLNESVREKQVQINNLENLIGSLQRDIQESDDLNLDLKQKNHVLDQHYQHQQGEISRLNQRLEELSRDNRVKSHKSTPQSTAKTVSTQEIISEAEYQEITNQSEYEYVRGYINSRSGKPVEPYYRRKKNR
jgi:chromosome segregation ATPase